MAAILSFLGGALMVGVAGLVRAFTARTPAPPQPAPPAELA